MTSFVSDTLSPLLGIVSVPGDFGSVFGSGFGTGIVPLCRDFGSGFGFVFGFGFGFGFCSAFGFVPADGGLVATFGVTFALAPFGRPGPRFGVATGVSLTESTIYKVCGPGDQGGQNR